VFCQACEPTDGIIFVCVSLLHVLMTLCTLLTYELSVIVIFFSDAINYEQYFDRLASLLYIYFVCVFL